MRSLLMVLAASVVSFALLAGPTTSYADQEHGNGWWTRGDDHPGNGPSTAPEIDMGLLGAASAVVAGGLVILRDRRRR
jgi:hypothetical protein